MRISFAPLEPDAVIHLTQAIGVDYTYGSFLPPNWFCMTARHDDNTLASVLACEFRTPFDVTFNVVVIDRRCLSKRLYRAVFKALFSQAVRVTAEIVTTNKQALRIVPRMGFIYEGYCRRGINGIHDALVFGMLKEDCVFLPGYAGGTTNVMEMPDGQHVQDSVAA